LPEITWYVIDGDDWGAMQAQWLADQFHSVLDVELLLTPITEDEADAMLWVDSETWPQIGSFFWYSDLPDPSGWLDFWLCDSDAFAIFIGYCNPEFDALYARADSELDPERRVELFEEVGHMLVADAPSIFVYNPTSAWLVKPYVAGYSRSAPQQQWPGWWAPLQVDLTQPT
jgi:ABC-type transport system substrate-binding protein